MSGRVKDQRSRLVILGIVYADFGMVVVGTCSDMVLESVVSIVVPEMGAVVGETEGVGGGDGAL